MVLKRWASLSSNYFHEILLGGLSALVLSAAPACSFVANTPDATYEVDSDSDAEEQDQQADLSGDDHPEDSDNYIDSLDNKIDLDAKFDLEQDVLPELEAKDQEVKDGDAQDLDAEELDAPDQETNELDIQELEGKDHLPDCLLQNYFPDLDGDGFGDQKADPVPSCDPIEGLVTNNQDCDDSNKGINPDAPELCNLVDDNCDGNIDENLPLIACYKDKDQDGFGSNISLETCLNLCPENYTKTSGDCDDNDDKINPLGTEICNGKDDNCNGIIDGLEEVGWQKYYLDQDKDGYGGEEISACKNPDPAKYVVIGGDCDDNDAAVHPNAAEFCDGKDNDCNGKIDEDLDFDNYYPDKDGDGAGDAKAAPVYDCINPSTEQIKYVTNKTDCDDSNKNISPFAQEVCNDVDDNCNGVIDGINEGIDYQVYYPDQDKDGYGQGGGQMACKNPDPNKYVVLGGDCDDDDQDVHPNKTEFCDGKDNDCNGGIDDGLVFDNYYPDKDGDGAGDAKAAPTNACKDPSNIYVKYVTNNKDCDDNNKNIGPFAKEVCDQVDNNCDGQVNEGLPFNNYWPDQDGDGFGDQNAAKTAWCADPSQPGIKYVTNNLDCNDSDININPFVVEVCNNLDDNCNGLVDDGLDFNNYYQDKDKDGFGGGEAVNACKNPNPAEYTLVGGDCDDNNKNVNPNAKEDCDGKDNDCNNKIDDGLEKIVACDVYNNNLNGAKTLDCVNGQYVEVAPCSDPDECTAGAVKPQVCSSNVGECQAGIENWKCVLDQDGVYTYVSQNDCSGKLPASEDLNGNGQCDVNDLDGKDNNCDGTVDEICMVNIPAGTFNQGCNMAIQSCNAITPNDVPPHPVALDEYDLDKFEVSNKQYKQCEAKGVCTPPSNSSSFKRSDYHNNLAYGNYPVIYVTWQQAADYCAFAGKILPTEAQWEKAAKGAKPSDNTYPWGFDQPNTTFVNYNNGGTAPDGVVGDTWPVDYVPEDPATGDKNLSPYSVANMSGNVSEWVADWYAQNYYSGLPSDNPTGPESGDKKVERGGNWYTTTPSKTDLYTYSRKSYYPSDNTMGRGFRCAKKK